MLLTRIYDSLLTVAYPQACRVCGGSVEQRRFGVVCKSCWDSTRIFTSTETICWKCGAPSPSSEFSPAIADSPAVRCGIRCHRCDAQTFTAARAAGPYEHGLRASLLESKRRPFLAPFLIQLLTDVAQRAPLNDATRVIPVPLHAKRLRERGFNQAAVIATAVASRLRLPLDETSLVRVSGSEKYRAGLDPRGRRDTVAGAFAVRHPRLVENEQILLIDDVFTTGATVDACSEALMASRARNVFVLTIARGKS